MARTTVETDGDVAAAWERLCADARETAAVARQLARVSSRDSFDELMHTVRNVHDNAAEYYQRSVEHTRTRPLISVLQWAGLGFVLGWLMSR
jgi:ElaB/YqjD/DUF883 family membrane-anchored ribosome-binding protein